MKKLRVSFIVLLSHSLKADNQIVLYTNSFLTTTIILISEHNDLIFLNLS